MKNPFALLFVLIISFLVVAVLPTTRAAEAVRQEKARIAFQPNDKEGQLRILIDGKEALVFCHGDEVDLPHYYPVRSPAGQSLIVQQTEPFPHHRAIWFADTVRLAGQRQVSFYNAYYGRLDKKDPKSPFRDRIRLVAAKPAKTDGNQADLHLKLLWEMDRKTPVLDEDRRMRIVALGQGQYFLDVQFTLAAAYDDVEFVSDHVHYAWPYARITPAFSVQKGGTITNSEGGVNQKGTDNQVARWVDYSNTVNGQTEGLTIFSHPDNPYPHRWLTRDYGTFGPRRPDAKSGKKFTLKKGETISQRVGILVHRGDVKTGLVAERFQQYVAGQLGSPKN